MHRVDVSDSSVAALAAQRGMAARIAHDVNNLLTPLIAYPELIRMHAEGNEQVLSLLGSMEKAAQDMLFLTGRLGAFAKGQEHGGGDTLFVDAVQAVVSELSGDGSRKIDVISGDSVADLRVPVREDAVREVVSQLLENALDATPDGGTVELGLSVEEVRRPLACAGGMLRAGRYAVLSVVDHAGGLADGDVDQAFEPLYTTRKTEKGRGAGLGLSVALAIMADISGGVDMVDEAAEGVTTRALFPLDIAAAGDPSASLASESSAADAAAVAEKLDASRYHGRVLIVDDEESIVDVFTIMLSEELPGIVVDSAGDGAAGVRLFEATQPDVVIMDLHMPIMDGLTAFKRMLEVSRETGRPMPKVIFCTGYAPPNEFDKLISERDAQHEVLYKPVSTRDLIERVASGVREA